MNKSNIEAGQAGTEEQESTTVHNQQVSQPNANTNVVGSLFGQREVKFKYIFKTYDGRFIVEIFTLKELEYGGLQNFLSGLHDIIIVAKCQYTGLKDLDGKEIYEGDIQDYGNGRKIIVEFEDGCFGLRMPNGDFERTWLRLNKFKVVGNIYENPELLTNK
jgi:hypothetical protein